MPFYVSFALRARKTALVLRSVFNIPISYQTVLNYAAQAAFYCHRFNPSHKGPIHDISAGDEPYVKVMGKYHHVFFLIPSKSLKITAYHLAPTRETLPALVAMKEAIHTADANPSYSPSIHFLSAQNTESLSLQHHKVIGLQNLDRESETFQL